MLDAGAVESHIVGAPTSAEFLTPRGQFTDEVVKGFVVRVTTGLGVQDCSARASASSTDGETPLIAPRSSLE
jgi:hypothetical protein